MQKMKTIDVLNGITKVIIFPFFYLLTFLLVLIITGLANRSFENNLGEAIEGVALVTIIIAPIILILLVPINIGILWITKKLYYLRNDWFLVFGGIVNAIAGILLILAYGWIISLF